MIQIQRWPEYVYVGNNTKCFLCGMAPYPSSSHINPDPTQLPLPLTAEETSPGECKASDACAEGVAPQGTMSLLETAQAASPEPLALPGKFSKFQSSKVRMHNTWTRTWMHCGAREQAPVVRSHHVKVTHVHITTHDAHTHTPPPQYAKRVLRIMQADSSTGLATALPDHNILSYDVIAYCPPGQAAASCALSTMALKVRM